MSDPAVSAAHAQVTALAGDFVPFPKLHRLSREMIVTEKLDGTNAQVVVLEDGRVYAASRTRWITPEADNAGFAAWVRDHADELRQLGPGRHFGEWWGQGVQRGYGLTEKRFSLFNVSRWVDDHHPTGARPPLEAGLTYAPACCHVVPILRVGPFDTREVDFALAELATSGSRAAPGFARPEGVVVFHVASGTLFKKTLDKNDGHKGG